ncbi:MAG: ribose-5-phosphate isomerase RpiA [Sulfobacillus thermotolerans]|nr:ribose-5-phosphate isomerase RpiA [Sulfobacillus thermotolerans]
MLDRIAMAKKMAAERAVEFVEDGMMVGLGTGSTAYWAIQRLGERVREGLKIQAVGTSERTEALAQAAQIPIVDFSRVAQLDVAIDGADEVSRDFALTKGGGGALLREKLVASAASRFIVIVDDTKLVRYLGKFPLPVEVVPFAWQLTKKRVEAAGCRSTLRMHEDQPFVTDNHNYILDCDFGEISDPASVHGYLKALPGVVETGLFINMAYVVVASDGQQVALHYPDAG